MPVRLSSRQLADPATSLKSLSSPCHTLCLRSLNHAARRTFTSTMPRLRASREEAPSPKAPSNPLLENYLKKKPSGPSKLVRGELASSSIFEQDREKGGKDAPTQAPAEANADAEAGSKPVRDPAAMSNVLDPDPKSRLLWERKKVIQSIRHRGRISRTLMLKRTEREHTSKSHFFKTSVLKLAPLARQITGKTIEDAILQMRFSKKKVSKDTAEHLDRARNQAIVARGMGLGEAEGTKGAPATIETKEGKRKVIDDRTGIYIDQAWVGRGPYGTDFDHRARGRINVMRPPTTSITVLLKENATKIRQHQERQEKRRNRKLWVQLPDRPVTAQRPYYSW